VLVERTPAVLVEVGVERRGDVDPDRAQTVERLGKLVGGIDALRAQRVDELVEVIARRGRGRGVAGEELDDIGEGEVPARERFAEQAAGDRERGVLLEVDRAHVREVGDAPFEVVDELVVGEGGEVLGLQRPIGREDRRSLLVEPADDVGSPRRLDERALGGRLEGGIRRRVGRGARVVHPAVDARPARLALGQPEAPGTGQPADG
jgi:hypothetical protein